MITRRQAEANQAEAELSAAPPDLDDITAALNRLPELADTLVGRPPEDLHPLYEAFDVQVRYYPEDRVADVEIILADAPGLELPPPTPTGRPQPASYIRSVPPAGFEPATHGLGRGAAVRPPVSLLVRPLISSSLESLKSPGDHSSHHERHHAMPGNTPPLSSPQSPKVTEQSLKRAVPPGGASTALSRMQSAATAADEIERGLRRCAWWQPAEWPAESDAGPRSPRVWCEGMRRTVSVPLSGPLPRRTGARGMSGQPRTYEVAALTCGFAQHELTNLRTCSVWSAVLRSEQVRNFVASSGVFALLRPPSS